MHGKVSRVKHDNRGCFKDISQGIRSIRYHSLSASYSTLPPELAVTAVTEDSNVIMGVRHRTYAIEAVQYHPESILSEEGDNLLRNFLALKGGHWNENPHFRVSDDSVSPFVDVPQSASKVGSVLEGIYMKRIKDVAEAETIPGQTALDLQAALSLNLAPPVISLYERLLSAGDMALIAEIRRASPVKGQVPTATPPSTLALEYALSGIHAISIQTDSTYAFGSMQDLRFSRLAIDHITTRPAIIRRDIIVSRYQILEARVAGADSIILSFSILPGALLSDLYAYSLELGMEPMVEVSTKKEMEAAVALSAKIIAVYGRNYNDATVNEKALMELAPLAPARTVVCAFTGIESAEDVKRARNEGAKAVLVGDSLVLSKDRAEHVRELLSSESTPSQLADWRSDAPVVKICGVRSKDEALAIANLGADMLGLMFVPKSKRFIDIDTAKSICETIRQFRISPPPQSALSPPPLPWLTSHALRFQTQPVPLLVGVFQNASLETVLDAVSYCQLDMVQLHGSEPVQWAKFIPVPVIRVFHIGGNSNVDGITRGGLHDFVLLDSMRDDNSGESGGSGKVVDLDFARRVVDAGEVVVDVNTAYRPEEKGPADRQIQPKPPLLRQDTDVLAEKQVAEKDAEVHGARHPEPRPLTVETSTQSAFKYPLPIILAGGLTPENVAGAIERVRPWAVDVSGGVELDDGTGKDLEKVESFISNAKEASRPPSALR